MFGKILVAMFLIAFVFALAWGFAELVGIAINRAEKFDCWKFDKYASTYPSFYLTQYEDDMCRAHGIIINAPVK